METQNMIVGFIMLYTWIHSVVIINKKIVGLKIYEKVVLCVGLTGFVLFLIGSLS